MADVVAATNIDQRLVNTLPANASCSENERPNHEGQTIVAGPNHNDMTKESSIHCGYTDVIANRPKRQERIRSDVARPTLQSSYDLH
jgi:hypothetical protein